MYDDDVKRTHKDRLFRLVFRDKNDLLALYNAINGSDYQNPEELEITTLENVIYMGTKNDVSFMIEDILNLWEHQSSFNPNMPIRGLFYFARLYRKYVEEHAVNLYSSRLKELPFPQYIVFYNGLKEEPDRTELQLSDSFVKVRSAKEYALEPCLEMRAIMLNINYGQNRELMERCNQLKEYAQFIACIRQMQQCCGRIEDAVDLAIQACISQGILKDILSVHRKEVVSLFLTEYNEQAHMKMERDEWIAVGEERGLQRGIQQGVQQGIQQARQIFDLHINQHLSVPEIARKLSIPEDSVREFLP